MKKHAFSVAFLAAAFSSSALAEVKTFNGSVSNFWRNPDNWTDSSPGPNTIPTAADRAVIPAEMTCVIQSDGVFVDAMVADTISVASTATLLIEVIGAGAEASLTLDNTDDNIGTTTADQSQIDGLVEMGGVDPGTRAAVLKFITNNHTVKGSGGILGHDNCKILLAPNLMLVNALGNADGGIRHKFTRIGPISGTATLLNRGLVHSDLIGEQDFGLIVLPPDLILRDTTAGEWKASDCSRMVFQRESTGLTGKFTLEAVVFKSANFYFEKTVVTSGVFQFDGFIDFLPPPPVPPPHFTCGSVTGTCPSPLTTTFSLYTECSSGNGEFCSF